MPLGLLVTRAGSTRGTPTVMLQALGYLHQPKRALKVLRAAWKGGAGSAGGAGELPQEACVAALAACARMGDLTTADQVKVRLAAAVPGHAGPLTLRLRKGAARPPLMWVHS